jgi:hypothetical protein
MSAFMKFLEMFKALLTGTGFTATQLCRVLEQLSEVIDAVQLEGFQRGYAAREREISHLREVIKAGQEHRRTLETLDNQDLDALIRLAGIDTLVRTIGVERKIACLREVRQRYGFTLALNKLLVDRAAVAQG